MPNANCDETTEPWLLNILLQHGIGISSLIDYLSCENKNFDVRLSHNHCLPWTLLQSWYKYIHIDKMKLWQLFMEKAVFLLLSKCQKCWDVVKSQQVMLKNVRKFWSVLTWIWWWIWNVVIIDTGFDWNLSSFISVIFRFIPVGLTQWWSDEGIKICLHWDILSYILCRHRCHHGVSVSRQVKLFLNPTNTPKHSFKSFNLFRSIPWGMKLPINVNIYFTKHTFPEFHSSIPVSNRQMKICSSSMFDWSMSHDQSHTIVVLNGDVSHVVMPRKNCNIHTG